MQLRHLLFHAGEAHLQGQISCVRNNISISHRVDVHVRIPLVPEREDVRMPHRSGGTARAVSIDLKELNCIFLNRCDGGSELGPTKPANNAIANIISPVKIAASVGGLA